MAEAERQVLLVGQSNSGMVDPLQMTAITLAIVSSALLVTRPNVDHIVALKILSDISNEIGPIAIELEKRSYAEANRKGAKRRVKATNKRPGKRTQI
jgi:hypothetical protein